MWRITIRLCALRGLAPRLRQSGKWAGQTRLSKTGDPLLRKALYMPMLSALSFNPAIRAFCQRLKASRRYQSISLRSRSNSLKVRPNPQDGTVNNLL